MKTKPLGNRLIAKNLTQEVVTCIEAADGKGIPLEAELKTLVLQTNAGIVAVNVRGSDRISLRKIKSFLDVKEAYIADTVILSSLGMTPGTVSPVIDPLWNMHQLIDNNVFSNKLVSTNNGTLMQYFVFDPHLMMDAPSIYKDDFSA